MKSNMKKPSRGFIIAASFCVAAILAASVYANKERILRDYGEKYPVLTKVLGEIPPEAHGDECGCGHDHAPAPAKSDCGHNHAPGESCSSNQTHAHDHGAELSFTRQALKNIGVTKETMQKIKVGNLPLTLDFPAIVAERPGRSTTNVTSPVSGIVLRIYRQPGEMLFPGEPMLDMDLANESEMAQQMELLSQCQKLEIVEQELARLAQVAEGLVTKTIRETEFEKRQLETQIESMVKTLTLSGFAEEDIRRIVLKEHRLIRQVTIPVPLVHDDRLCTQSTLLVRDTEAPADAAVSQAPVGCGEECCGESGLSHLQLVQLFVKKGQRVSAGEQLSRIADMTRLYLCGRAWDYDEAVLMESLAKNVPVDAVFRYHEVRDRNPLNSANILTGLRIKYVDNTIDADTRTLNFFVEFQNELLGCACPDHEHPAVASSSVSASTNAHVGHNHAPAESAKTAVAAPTPATAPAAKDTAKTPNDSRALHWKYRPGQRCELQVQYDEVPGCILLPKEAVAASGIEFYVFRLVHDNGDHLSLLPVSVHVVHQGRDVVAVANDGALPKNAVLAMRGASQLVVAMNAARGGGGVPESTCACDDH